MSQGLGVIRDMAKWEKWLLVGILALSAGVRLTGLDLGWFMMDQARDATEALKIAKGQNFPIVGPIARNLYALGPLYYYVIAAPFWLSSDPWVVVLFINLLNLVSVYLAWRIGREFFSPTAGLVAAALYGVFPMAVVSSKGLWNPGLIPFFTVIFFYALYSYLIAGRAWGLTVAIMALGCLLQIHLSALALGLVLLLSLLLFRQSFAWRHALAGLAFVVILFVPYFVFEAQRDFQAFPDAFRFIGQDSQVVARESQLEMPWKALQGPFNIAVRMAQGFSSARAPFFTPVQRLELALFVGGFFWVFLSTIRRWRQDGAVPRAEGLLLLWIVVSVSVLIQKKQALAWYYFDLLYPAQFLVIGIVTDRALQATARKGFTRLVQRVASWSVALVVGLIVFTQIFFLAALRREVLSVGSLRLPTEIMLRFPDPLWFIQERGFLEIMAMKYKRALTEAILADSPLDEAAFHGQIHGSAFEDLLEDRGFFFHILRRGETKGGTEAHYAVLRERDWPGSIEGAFRKIGPFWLVKYQPSIRSSFWKNSDRPGPGWFDRTFDDSTWTAKPLPARNLPDRSVYAQTPLSSWGGSPIYCRGWIEANGMIDDLHLILALRDLPLKASRHGIEALYLNGRRIEPIASRSYLTPVTRSTEVVYEVGPSLNRGLNLIAFEVAGGYPDFDLDVYEVRWRPEKG